jgi:hypothetical protein
LDAGIAICWNHPQYFGTAMCHFCIVRKQKQPTQTFLWNEFNVFSISMLGKQNEHLKLLGPKEVLEQPLPQMLPHMLTNF